MSSPSVAAAPAATTPPGVVPADLKLLHGVARRLLGCDHLAHDAVQEALLALWQQPSLPPEPRGWLVRAVVHRSRHLRRTVRRRQRHEHIASTHCQLHGDCDNPLHVAIAHEVGELRASVLDSLPAAQRRALELYEHDGLDYAGIASRLGIPVGTVRSRIARARDAVRAALLGAADD